MVLRWLANQLLGRKAPLLKVGDAAPDFEVLDHTGQTVTLQGLLGKRFVLWFYPKASTPG